MALSAVAGKLSGGACLWLSLKRFGGERGSSVWVLLFRVGAAVCSCLRRLGRSVADPVALCPEGWYSSAAVVVVEAGPAVLHQLELVGASEGGGLHQLLLTGESGSLPLPWNRHGPGGGVMWLYSSVAFPCIVVKWSFWSNRTSGCEWMPGCAGCLAVSAQVLVSLGSKTKMSKPMARARPAVA